MTEKNQKPKWIPAVLRTLPESLSAERLWEPVTADARFRSMPFTTLIAPAVHDAQINKNVFVEFCAMLSA